MGSCNSRVVTESDAVLAKVFLLNREGKRIARGYLIIASDWMEHIRSDSPVSTRWNLEHVRQFGCDKNYFTFEIVKKANNESGFFAFETRTSKAKQLYRVLDAKVHKIEVVRQAALKEEHVARQAALQEEHKKILELGLVTVKKSHYDSIQRLRLLAEANPNRYTPSLSEEQQYATSCPSTSVAECVSTAMPVKTPDQHDGSLCAQLQHTDDGCADVQVNPSPRMDTPCPDESPLEHTGNVDASTSLPLACINSLAILTSSQALSVQQSTFSAIILGDAGTSVREATQCQTLTREAQQSPSHQHNTITPRNKYKRICPTPLASIKTLRSSDL